MIKTKTKTTTPAPMAHQQESLDHDDSTPIVFDTSDPGTGKTAVRIWAFARRRRSGGGCALVLAPRTLLRTAWANDVAKFAPDLTVSVATADNRAEAFATAADIYITNHDAVKWLAAQPAAFFKRFDELIVDESPAYKHHTSQRSRAVAKIVKHFKHRKLLSATPTGNGICDIWHQAYLLDGGRRLGPTFYGFRNSVCTPIQVGRNAAAVRWEDKDGAEEAVFGLLSDIVIRHRFEDCVDIPATHQYSVKYELTPRQRKVYDQMEQDQLLWLLGSTVDQVARKLKAEPPKLTAVNAAAVATKLLQIASGAVYSDDGKHHVVDRGRYELLLDLAQARKHPLVYFFWQHQREALVLEAEKRSMRFAVLDGHTSDAERAQMVATYQAGGYDVMFAHPQSAAHGLTLTRGTSVIWSGPTYNLEWFEQGNRRQARIGQKEKTEIVVVLAEGTLEEKVYAMLTDKAARMDNLLDLFASLRPTPQPAARTAKRVAVAA